MPNHVFVYGTLRTGDCRGSVLDPDKIVCGEAFIKGFTLHDLGSFPGILEGEGKVRGEMHEVDARTLETLDHIEGYRADKPSSSLYLRKATDIFNSNDEVVGSAWVYVFNIGRRAAALRLPPLIESGDWFEHRGLYTRVV